MLPLERIMEIAEESARRMRSAGDLDSDRENTMAICVAIQEALAENDEKKKRRPLKEVRRALSKSDPYAKSNGAYRSGQARPPTR